MQNDLVLSGGRVIDPLNGLDALTDVAFRDGRISEIGTGLDATDRRDVSGAIVTPGLIDLHTHVSGAERLWGSTLTPIPPDQPRRP
jgi:dihydroorotase